MLTKKQKEIYDFVTNFIQENDYSPSLEEIGDNFDLAVSTIHEHIEGIKRKGFINKRKKHARTIEPKIKEDNNLISIPILGTIAAGQPIETIEVPDETIQLSKNDVNKSGNYYALRVKGDSMIEDGIFDGDIVVIKQQSYADDGQTVVAIIDKNEATLKKIYWEENRARLQPANQALFPIYTDEIEIRGIVIKIVRNIEDRVEPLIKDKGKFSRRIDYSWDFRGEKTKPYTHGLHTYPAMFIPQVARRLIKSYSQKGNTICDIFCGSGTALIESRLMGRNSYGIDLNPLAIFLAKVKTTAIEPKKITKEYYNLINRIEKIKEKEIEKPNFFNIDFWFKEKIIIKLSRIKKAIKQIENNLIRNFFMIAFSETVRLSSNTKNGEFKLVRISKEKLDDYDPDVISIFKNKCELNINGMTDYYNSVDKNTWTKIILGDSSKNNGIQPNSIDAIITSPPYGDSRTTVAYGQFSRLSAQWIDIFEDPNTASGLDKELLGGKPMELSNNFLKSKYLNQVLTEIRKKDEKRAKDVFSFYIDLEKCLRQAHRILKRNAYFCIVIGNRLVKQVRIPTDFIIAELCENIGFKCEDIFVRNIPGKRMPIKNSPTNVAGQLEETMNKESIVILKKL
jgi:SOS regulatory protein LexA